MLRAGGIGHSIGVAVWHFQELIGEAFFWSGDEVFVANTIDFALEFLYLCFFKKPFI